MHGYKQVLQKERIFSGSFEERAPDTIDFGVSVSATRFEFYGVSTFLGLMLGTRAGHGSGRLSSEPIHYWTRLAPLPATLFTDTVSEPSSHTPRTVRVRDGLPHTGGRLVLVSVPSPCGPGGPWG